jgi:hypothetical protein
MDAAFRRPVGRQICWCTCYVKVIIAALGKLTYRWYRETGNELWCFIAAVAWEGVVVAIRDFEQFQDDWADDCAPWRYWLMIVWQYGRPRRLVCVAGEIRREANWRVVRALVTRCFFRTLPREQGAAG